MEPSMPQQHQQDDCGYMKGCVHELYANEYTVSAGIDNMYLCDKHMRFHFCGGSEKSDCVMNEEGVCHYSRHRRDPIATANWRDGAPDEGDVVRGDGSKLPDVMDMQIPSEEKSMLYLLTGDYENFHRIIYGELMQKSEAFRATMRDADQSDVTPGRTTNRRLSFILIRCIYDAVQRCDRHLNLPDEKLLELLCQFISDMCMPKNSYHFNSTPKDTGVSLQKKNMLFSNIFIRIAESIKHKPELRHLIM